MKKQTNKQSLLLCAHLKILGFTDCSSTFTHLRKDNYILSKHAVPILVIINKYKSDYRFDFIFTPNKNRDAYDITNDSYKNITKTFITQGLKIE